jgi:ABC-2 type transport system ATP-binding protein
MCVSGDQNLIAERQPAEDEMVVVAGVGHRYPGAERKALSDIALTVRRGSCFGLLGPNGAGKSTLLSLMTGVLSPQAGEITVAGHSARRDLGAIRRISALAPQDFAFYPALTGAENLAFFAGVYRLTAAQRKDRLEKAVAATQLSDWLGKRAETYSGGLKRRLNLAIALLNAPQVLYLDEPTVGIDARSRQCILEAIQGLRAEGTTIVYTSHYMEEVEALCDEVAIINLGKLVAQGRTEDLLNAAAARRLAVTLEAPLGDAARAVLAPLKIDWLGSDRLELSLATEGDLAAALECLRAAGGRVAKAQFGVSRLETLYLSLLDEPPEGEA